MMIPMPILALEKVHQAEPRDVAARVLSQRDARLAMADAVDEALSVQREHQPDRAEPEEGAHTEIQWAEKRQREYRRLHPAPCRQRFEIGAVAIDRRIAGLPQPSEMRPPESAPHRAGDIIRRVGLGMMETMAGRPGERIARAVGHREKDQRRTHPWIQLERAMGKCAMVCDGGSDAADPGEPERTQEHLPSRQRVEDQAYRGGHM